MIRITHGTSVNGRVAGDEMVAPGISDGKRFDELNHGLATRFRR